VDSFGCLLDECNPSPNLGEAVCQDNIECVQVPADCCGCALGGSDTAVLAGEATSFDDNLACDQNISCPGINVCEPSEAACVAGQCVLRSTVDMGPSNPVVRLCGSAELPPCESGEVCVLNDPEANDASAFGVGVCRPA